MGWGKGSENAAPPPVMQQDNSAMMMAMMEMMMAQSAHVPEAPQPPAMPEIPAISKPPDIDWASRQDTLKNKARAGYNVDEARRKGRTDTILTSPLLDDEEANITSSILSGS